MMNLETLSIEEQKYICDRVSIYDARAYFQKYPKQFNEIKPGFRPEKLSESETLFQILTKNISKPFISSFLEKTVTEWLKGIYDTREQLMISGYSEEEALIQSVIESPFCDNCALYFKLSEQECDERYLVLFREAMSLLQRAADAEEQNRLGLEWKNGQKELDEARSTIKALEAQVDDCQSKESQLIEKCSDLENETSIQKERIEKTTRDLENIEEKCAEMQSELEYYRRLNNNSDIDFEQENYTDYQHVSVGIVKRNFTTGKPYILRLADISDGELVPFSKDDSLPTYFGNRTVLYCNNGVEQEDRIGVWSWSSEQKEADPSRDVVVSEYNSDTKLTEVFELTQCKSLGEIASLLGDGIEKCINENKVLFVFRTEKTYEGLLCFPEDLEVRGTKIRLSSSVYKLRHYSIKPADIVTLAGVRFYRYMNLGIPQSIYRVRTPYDVVKGMILARTTLSSLRELDLTKKEAQKSKQFIESIPTQTLVEEFADAYACSEEEAREYVQGFIEHVENYLSGEDLDLGIISQALGRNPDLVELCKEQLSEEWKSENELRISEANSQLRSIKQEVDNKRKEEESLNLEISRLSENLLSINKQIENREKIAVDVEKRIADRIEAARSNAADFIAQMAFMPQATTSCVTDGAVGSPKTFAVYCSRSSFVDNGSVEDIDSFEEELTENIEIVGYKEETAVEMAQAISFGICCSVPIILGANAVCLAQALATTLCGNELTEVFLNSPTSIIESLTELIENNLADVPKVYLIHGVFDGFNISQFNEIENLARRLDGKAILILSIQNLHFKMLGDKVWNSAIYVDGDEGYIGGVNEPLHSVTVKMPIRRQIDKKEYLQKRKELIPYTSILSNLQIATYSKYLAAYNAGLNESPTIIMQIITVACSSGNENELSVLFRDNGVENGVKTIAKYIGICDGV